MIFQVEVSLCVYTFTTYRH